jgi:hypothetical protein
MTKIDDMPLPQIAQSLHQLVDRMEGLVSSPAIEQSVQHLDRSLSHLDRVTQEASVKLGPLVDELRRAADAAQAKVTSANNVLGGQACEARPSDGQRSGSLGGAARSDRAPRARARFGGTFAAGSDRRTRRAKAARTDTRADGRRPGIRHQCCGPGRALPDLVQQRTSYSGDQAFLACAVKASRTSDAVAAQTSAWFMMWPSARSSAPIR